MRPVLFSHIHETSIISHFHETGRIYSFTWDEVPFISKSYKLSHHDMRRGLFLILTMRPVFFIWNRIYFSSSWDKILRFIFMRYDLHLIIHISCMELPPTSLMTQRDYVLRFVGDISKDEFPNYMIICVANDQLFI